MSFEEYVAQAERLDAQYPCHKEDFVFPTHASMGCLEESDKSVNYLCGNSLGLMPKRTREDLNKELDAWAARAVESHFKNTITTDWMDTDLPIYPVLKQIVGANESEIGVMGTLTMNLNSLLISFYRPEGRKRKILFEKGAFPSDYYALYNLARLKGLDPDDVLLQIEPLEGEYCLRTEEIIKTIEQNADEIALICFSGIQYYTGQFFDIEGITKAGHDHGCVVGWDLAHAAGNVELKLHSWNVDFAVWCSYKYLNSGPGAIGGFFIHEKHTKGDDRSGLPRLAGWWGNDATVRFQMLEKFSPIESALGFRQSNPSVIDCSTLKSSLAVFEKYGGIGKLRSLSIERTAFLEKLLKSSKYYRTLNSSRTAQDAHFIIITPEDPKQRGTQLSLLFKPEHVMQTVFTYMNERGTICDERRPNVIRLAPTALYNSFTDCVECVRLLEEGMATV